MNNVLKYAGLMMIVVGLQACNKDDDGPSGGKGGNATLRITPKHHQPAKDSVMVYIKYNTLDKPSSYDDSARTQVIGTDTVATFTGLKKGNYYIYGYGWDPAIQQNIKGGIPYVITEEVTQSLVLPVTED